MKRFLILVLVLILLIATVAGFWVTSIATLTLYPTKDSYSWQSEPLSNNGYSDNLQITSANFPPLNMRGWVAFNVSGIPANAWVIQADFRLKLWSKSPNDPSHGYADSTGRIYGVYRLTQPWEESGVIWMNQPNYTDEHHAVAPVPPGESGWAGPAVYMHWDISNIVRDWQSGIQNDGLLVRDTQENSPILYSTQFFTHDKVPNISYVPRLTVTYVMPQSVALFVAILLVEVVSITVFCRARAKRRGPEVSNR
jgi:hypothetical protein